MKYKLGYRRDGKWHYVKFATEEDMMESLYDIILWAERVTIVPIHHIDLKKG